MLNKKIKAILITTLLSISASAFSAGVPLYKENQGLQPTSFDQSYFLGQWEMASDNHVGNVFNSGTNFINATPGSSSYLEKLWKGYQKNGDKYEKRVTVRAFYSQKESFKSLQLQETINNKFSNRAQYEKYLKDNNKKTYDILDETDLSYPEYNSKNGNKSISFLSFNEKGAMKGAEVFVLGDYENHNFGDERTYEVLNRSIYTLEQNKNFDLVKGTDFFFYGLGVTLYAIDIVDNDSFILYNLNDNVGSLIVRTENIKATKTYNDILKEFNDKMKKEKSSQSFY